MHYKLIERIEKDVQLKIFNTYEPKLGKVVFIHTFTEIDLA